MINNHKIPIPTIRRIPIYYRTLSELKELGESRTSSKELSIKTGFNASQIRQDLNHFGDFGRSGYGYSIASLHAVIEQILGLNNFFSTIIIGAGNLGKTITHHIKSLSRGINLVGVFDKDKTLIGEEIDDKRVQDIKNLEKFCLRVKPKIAILCLPNKEVEDTLPKLEAYGIKGIWNFSNYDIKRKYPRFEVENVHLSDSIMTLCFLLNNETP